MSEELKGPSSYDKAAEKFCLELAELIIRNKVVCNISGMEFVIDRKTFHVTPSVKLWDGQGNPLEVEMYYWRQLPNASISIDTRSKEAHDKRE